VDLRRKSPAALAELIAEKLRSVTKGTHRERHILVPQDFDTADYVLFSTPLKDHTGLYIAVDPQQYLSFRDILDDLFINYFSSHVDPFTYGSQWIVRGEPFRKRLIVPIQWVSQPWHTINEIAPEWLYSSLVELGLTSNTHWHISVVRDTTLMLPGSTTTLGDIIRRSVGPSYVFGCDNPQLWSLITSEAKAIHALLPYLMQESLDCFVVGSHKYVGVFADWLNIGSGCAWVERGEQLPNELWERFKR
jgi:hypothetical protein